MRSPEADIGSVIREGTLRKSLSNATSATKSSHEGTFLVAMRSSMSRPQREPLCLKKLRSVERNGYSKHVTTVQKASVVVMERLLAPRVKARISKTASIRCQPLLPKGKEQILALRLRRRTFSYKWPARHTRARRVTGPWTILPTTTRLRCSLRSQ